MSLWALNLSPPFSVSLFVFLCFLTIVWGAVPPLFLQPVGHQPIFHPAFHPLSLVGSSFLCFRFHLHFRFLTLWWQLNPPFRFLPDRLRCVMMLTHCWVNQSSHGGLTGSIVYCHPSLSYPTTWDCQSHRGKRHRTKKTGRASRPGPNLLIQTVDGVVTCSRSYLISCGHNTVSHLWNV